MDKGKWQSIELRKVKKEIKRRLAGVAKALLGVFGCCLFIGGLLFLAENGSPIFYYAVALSSPGSTIEYFGNMAEEGFAAEDAFSGASEEPEQGSPDENDQPEEPTEETIKPEKAVPEVPEERRGKVTETHYSASPGGIYVPYGNAIIKNCTGYSSEKILSVLKDEHGLYLSTDLGDTPQVLIYHTHATEGYEPADRGYFDVEVTWRSTDPSENMIAVGDALCAVLTENGIGVVHDGTLHDDPSYNGSYKRSAVTIKKHLEENPEITVCLDIHRDAIEPSKTEIVKPTAVINGKKAAQIMIIAGCDDGTMNMPDFFENLKFAAALADKLETLYPGLCRPVLFDYRKYNMDLSPGLLLIEIGATGNTLEEAQYSAELLGNALVELLAE